MLKRPPCLAELRYLWWGYLSRRSHCTRHFVRSLGLVVRPCNPIQTEMTLPIGETGLAFYTATNNSDRPVAGTSTFNVTPLKIGGYFVKIDCFCFTEQVLMPGESVEMPVTFYVDPGIRDDRETEEVQGVTLSYTFFETEISDPELAGLSQTGPTLN